MLKRFIDRIGIRKLEKDNPGPTLISREDALATVRTVGALVEFDKDLRYLFHKDTDQVLDQSTVVGSDTIHLIREGYLSTYRNTQRGRIAVAMMMLTKYLIQAAIPAGILMADRHTYHAAIVEYCAERGREWGEEGEANGMV